MALRKIKSTSIADDAIDSDHYVDASIDNAHLADDAIDADKLASNSVVSASIVDGAIVNADINASAAIAQSKLALDITNSDINASAAIAQSKLSLDITNSDINASAAIAQSKLATLAIDTAELADDAVTVAKMNDSAYLANRNYIINGNFEVAQRGTSFSPTTGSGASLMYTLDRWYGYRSASTAIMQQISDGSSPDGFRCHARMGRTDSTSDTGYFIIGQQIETKNACALAGQTVCLSMWAKKHANFSGDWGIYVTTGTGSDESAWNSIGGGWTGGGSAYSSTTVLSDVTTSWVKRSISFSVAAGVKEIAIKHHFSSFSGTSVTNDYVEVAGVQLEIGSVATPFEHKSYGQELAACQRYYREIAGYTGVGRNSPATIRVSCPISPEMRATPSVALGSTNNFQDGDGTVIAGDGLSNLSSTSSAYAGTFTVSGTAPQSHRPYIHAASSGGTSKLDAEL